MHRFWRLNFDLGRLLVLLAVTTFGQSQAGEKISYSSRKLDGEPVAVVCVHVRLNKNPLKFGHSALTIFKLDPVKPGHKALVSRSAEWTGYWIARIEDEGSWEEKNFEKFPQTARKTYFPLNGGINHFRAFETMGSNKDSERICIPATQTQLAGVYELIENRRNKKYSLKYNCNDFTTQALALLTHNEIKFDVQGSGLLSMSLPAELRDQIRNYHAAHPPDKDATLDYQPDGQYEREMLAAYDELNRKLQGDSNIRANCVVKGVEKDLP